MASTEVEAPNTGEMSPEEHQARVDQCFAIEQDIKSNLRKGREALWDLMHALYEFSEENGWTALGYDTQEEWLAQPEIGLTRTQFFRYVRKWRELVVRREIPVATLAALEPSKVDIVMPAIEANTGAKKVEKILSDVASLGARDLRELYVRPSTAAPVNGDGGDGAGKSTTVDDEPVLASDVPTGDDDVIEGTATEAKSDKDAERERKQQEKMLHAAGVVDSWLAVGGDRRKAQRNWTTFVADHPLMVALRSVELCLEGGEDAPDKADAKVAWALVVETLGLDLED